MPIVKAKIGPRVMSLMCDPKVFDQIPIKAEVKAEVSGIYIVGEEKEDVVEDCLFAQRVLCLYQNLDKVLNEREKTIIIRRYGLNGKEPMTQSELADRLGISRSYISRIEKKALLKLKKLLEDAKL